MSRQTAVIVIPTYNEVGNVRRLLQEITEAVKPIDNWNMQILIVDSLSPDGTAGAVRELQRTYSNLHLLETPKEGLGKAYGAGFAHALDKLGADVLFEMDADLQHDPKLIPRFIRQIDEGADFVIGSRYIRGGSIPKNWELNRKIYSVLGNLIIRMGFMKLSITDWTSGYRAIRAYIIRENLSTIKKYTSYVFQVALLDNAIKQHAHVVEIPLKFTDRTHGSSKINSGKFMSDTLLYIVRNSSFLRYIAVGGSGFIIDFSVLYLLFSVMDLHVGAAQAISAEMAIVSNFLGNNFWSFSHKRSSGKRALLKNFAKFNSVALGSLLMQVGAISAYEHYFGHQYVYVFKMVFLVIVVIPYSYILYNKVIWKSKKQ